MSEEPLSKDFDKIFDENFKENKLEPIPFWGHINISLTNGEANVMISDTVSF